MGDQVEKSLVNLAYDALSSKNYKLALKYFEEAGELLGKEFFRVNLEICKKYLNNIGGDLNHDINISFDRLLEKEPVWTNYKIQPGETYIISAVINVKNGGGKSAIALFEILDKNGNSVDSGSIKLARSQIYGANFLYLKDSADNSIQLLKTKMPVTASLIKIGFCLFDASSNTEVVISDVKVKKVIEKSEKSIVEKIKYSNEFRVAMIADEFTYNSYKDEFNVILFEPNEWREVFENKKPDIFFCESAWSGHDSNKRPWKGRVYASENFKKENRVELLDILKYCKIKKIPTIFWNKEDPTHHEDKVHDFVKTAKEFDYVFTTAEECVESYKNKYKIDNVFSLPFATNPKLFNPIESSERSSKVVFAGSWYANHIKRCEEMERIFDGLIKNGFQLEIYDRYYGTEDKLHQWPYKYQKFLLPSKTHDEMPKVYKSSKIGLNFNTVVDSSTMFARRVFEMMSSNTLVVSNYSIGTHAMFPELIVYPDDDSKNLSLLTDEKIEEIREKALHKVLSEHTYTDRWIKILTCAGIPFLKREPTLTFAFIITNRSIALDAIAWYQQNSSNFQSSKLLLIADESMDNNTVAEIYKEFNRFTVTVTSANHAIKYSMLKKYKPIETSHFIGVNIGNKLNATVIRNSLLHLKYIDNTPIGFTNELVDKYKYKNISWDVPVINSSENFIAWIKKDFKIQNTYMV